jgi:hypothetical protein
MIEGVSEEVKRTSTSRTKSSGIIHESKSEDVEDKGEDEDEGGNEADEEGNDSESGIIGLFIGILVAVVVGIIVVIVIVIACFTHIRRKLAIDDGDTRSVGRKKAVVEKEEHGKKKNEGAWKPASDIPPPGKEFEEEKGKGATDAAPPEKKVTEELKEVLPIGVSVEILGEDLIVKTESGELPKPQLSQGPFETDNW